MNKHSIFAILFAGMAAFCSCESDRDSNPVLQQPTEFLLNTPGLSNNVFDLKQSSFIELTCTQPNYGFTAAVSYSVEISLQSDFKSSTVLPTQYTSAKMNIDASELAVATTSLLVEAGKTDVDFPLEATIYIRLIAQLEGNIGKTTSNSIEINANLDYSLPPVELPKKMYFIGDFCEWNWDKAFEMIPVNGADGIFWRLIYLPDNSGFKFNSATSWDGNDIGFDKITVNDNQKAEIRNADGNIGITKGGWYLCVIKTEAVGTEIKYTLDINEPAVYLFGPAIGDIWEAKDTNKFTVPEKANDFFVSPAFTDNVPTTTDAGVRACVVINGYDWWKSEFIIFNEKLEYRGNGGDQDRIGCKAGQKLYINFTAGTGKIE